MKAIGRKYDSDKARFDLLPPNTMLEISHVLRIGARKYDDNNWLYVEGYKKRYMAAALRHLNAHARGERYDEETGYSHISAAITSLMFINERAIINDKAKTEKPTKA